MAWSRRSDVAPTPTPHTATRAVAAAAAVLLLGACTSGAAGTTDPSADTGAEAAPSGDAPAPASGGQIVMALTQEPGSMSRLFDDQSAAELSTFVVEPLLLPLADGSYEPLLAEQVPTVENGDVSEDGLSVTYRLREGITWSDGDPFDAEDLAFTVDVIKDEANATVAGPEYGPVEEVVVVDDLTVEVVMSEPNRLYLDLFQDVLPSHRFDSTQVDTSDELVELPLGTGPFVFTEWRRGDGLELERNDAYWRDPEKPYLDGISVRVVPDTVAATSSFTNGEYDTVFFFVSADLPNLLREEEAGAPIEVAIQETPSWVEWLWLNHSAQGDPGSPNPVLSDPAVREAIDLAIDRQGIIDSVLEGQGTLVGSYLYAGWGASAIDPTPFDPEAAAAVLEGAGWVEGSDGIRVKDGTRAELSFMTIAGDASRELYQQIIQQNLADVGIEVTIQNRPAEEIFAGYEDDGALARGAYDLMMSRDGYYIDPKAWTEVFTTASIPTADNPGGFSYSFWSDPEFDALATEAGAEIDVAAAQPMYAELAERFAAERVALPLYSSTWGWAWSEDLEGVDATTYWDGIWPSVADWLLTR
jgi:peptide/nickel transport system substrate-binding protein